MTADGWIQSLAGATQKKGATINAIFDIPADTLPPEALYAGPPCGRPTRIASGKRGNFSICSTTNSSRRPRSSPLGTPSAPPGGLQRHGRRRRRPRGRTDHPGRHAVQIVPNPATSPRPRPAAGRTTPRYSGSGHRPGSSPLRNAASQSYPFEGIRVLDFGRAFAGPFAPMVLAGLGADVIKVATPDSTPARRGWPELPSGVNRESVPYSLT